MYLLIDLILKGDYGGCEKPNQRVIQRFESIPYNATYFLQAKRNLMYKCRILDVT